MDEAATYERISDDREGREVGVGRQREDNRALAEREGLTIVADYEDNDLSASTKARKERPAYKQLIEDAKAGKFKVIIAYSSSRLTRRPREHEDQIDLAQQYGIQYRFVNSPSFDLNTAAGRQVARTLAAADAGVAELTAELVQRAVRGRAEKREPHGGARGFGISPDGRSLIDSEVETIQGWAESVLAGDSLRSLAAAMNDAGVPTLGGATRWRGEVIRKILLAPRTAGFRVLDGQEYPMPHPPILERATWDALHVILEDDARRAVDHPGPARQYLGVGFYQCERCSPATVNSSYSQTGQRLYKCLRCWRSWRADPIDEWLGGPGGLIERLLAREDARERLLPRQVGDGSRIKALSAERKAIRKNMDEVAARFVLAGGETANALQVALKRGEDRLAEIRRELHTAASVSPLATLLDADDPVEAWRGSDVPRRQAFAEAMMTVKLGAPIRGRARWDATKFITVEPRTGADVGDVSE